jgi:hypothetical protein
VVDKAVRDKNHQPISVPGCDNEPVQGLLVMQVLPSWPNQLSYGYTSRFPNFSTPETFEQQLQSLTLPHCSWNHSFPALT